jgi:ankyrin repeat protein
MKGGDSNVNKINQDTTTIVDNNNINEQQEQPTIDEQHKLLTLAAKHDRVDVIQSLLNDSASNMYYDILLMGTINNGSNDSKLLYIPPPLHVAVKNGSVNAASCLLRMGADPSIRPSSVMGTVLTNATTTYYNNNDAHGCMDKDGMTSLEEYNTLYVGLSAWELAFGDTGTYADDYYHDDVNNEKESELNTTTMGWFGRRSSSVTPNTNNDNATSTTSSLKIGKSSKKKTEPSIIISPTKLVGIRNAFMSEAMRAIGADEVNRLMQLLNAGIHPTTEVMVGKTLLDWACDMDAMNCRELLSSYRVDDDDNEEDEEDSEATTAPEKNIPLNNGEKNELSTKFDHLYDLSMDDIRMLIAKNHILIPQLTNCRDDMAMETSICQSILHGSDEGGGVLTSNSMIDIVRGLKDQRTRAEESCIAWQAAWEEREDELDFFWEEVLDDELREELCVIFDQVDEDEVEFSLDGGGMSTLSIVNGQQLVDNDDNAASIDEQHILIEQFIELDNRVNELRASISSLAEESSTFLAEINRQGMGGALLMTKTLRDEVKEWEKKLHMARVGESLCRRKIDIIQHSIDGRYEVDGDEEIIDHDKTTCMSTPTAGDGGKRDDDDLIIEDYQLLAIVQRNQQEQLESISSPQCNNTKKMDMTVGKSNDNIAEIDTHENELRTAATTIVRSCFFLPYDIGNNELFTILHQIFIYLHL